MVGRYGLRDDQSSRIKDLLPRRKETVGVRAKDNRLFMEAAIYRCYAGIPRRDLPERFRDWNNIYRRHRKLSEVVVWQMIFESMSEDADNEHAVIDSTIVRAHQHAGGAKRGTKNKMHWEIERRLEHKNSCGM